MAIVAHDLRESNSFWREQQVLREGKEGREGRISAATVFRRCTQKGEGKLSAGGFTLYRQHLVHPVFNVQF